MMDRLLKAVASLLRHCGQEECAETDFEKAVVEARDALADALLARSATDAIPDVRLDGDGMLDEICADNVHLERLDRNYWFLSVSGGGKEVAAWLSSSPTFEWREGSPRSEAEPTADARDAVRWRAFCNLWAASTELKVAQEEDGSWSIFQVEDVEGECFGKLVGETPDDTIDKAVPQTDGPSKP